MNITNPQDLGRIINPSPKTRFQSSTDNIAKHRDLVDSREFVRASDFALLQYIDGLRRRESNPAVIGMKVVGALEYLDEMRLLSERLELKPVPRVDDNLKPQ